MDTNPIGVTSREPERAAAEAQHAQQREQLARLAHEFEAMFLSEMLKGMRESMLDGEEEGKGLGFDAMQSTFDGELGRTLSGAGGFGLASVLLNALDLRYGNLGSQTPEASDPTGLLAPSAPAAPATAPVERATPAIAAIARSSAAIPLPGAGAAAAGSLPGGAVTSPFGWRNDPLNGRAQFHAGTDIRMAYGQEVRAVAPGRVVSADERPGYGLTVVVDHGQGLETRYAHLSGFAVKAGDVVEAGQVVAQSGSSGRSTGPHLHLEARRHGQAVDLYAALKRTGLAADYAASQTLARSSHED